MVHPSGARLALSLHHLYTRLAPGPDAGLQSPSARDYRGVTPF